MEARTQVRFAVALLVISMTGCQAAKTQPGIQSLPTAGIVTQVPATQAAVVLITPPANALTDIVQAILADPKTYAGQNVVIVGNYRGWNLLGEAAGESPLTRSDWVIKDNSGAIYVSAEGEWLGDVSLVPGSMDDTTKVLRLTGVVRLTAAGQPYIEPTQAVVDLTTPPANAFTDIVQAILADPKTYAGQQVVIVGNYRGWNLLGEAAGESPLTRSDWVIKDHSGAIYVSAQGQWLGDVSLVPGSMDDTTKVLRLTGIVRLTSNAQPYIEPSLVELIP